MQSTEVPLTISGSRLELFGALLASVFFCSLALASIGGWMAPPRGGQIWSYVTLGFFGVIGAIALARLRRCKEPVITITPHGIRDTRVAKELVPWTAVSSISTWGYLGQRFMVLAIDPAAEAKLELTLLTRCTRTLNRLLGANGLCVGTTGLGIGMEKLLTTSRALWEQAKHAATHTAPTRD